MKRVPRHSREVFAVSLVAVAVQLVLTFALGLGFASVVVAAALVGFQLGSSRGFRTGLDVAQLTQATLLLERVRAAEEDAGEHLAPDHPERLQLAAARAGLEADVRRLS